MGVFNCVLLVPSAQPCAVRTSRDPWGNVCARAMPLSDTVYTSACGIHARRVRSDRRLAAPVARRERRTGESRAERAGRFTGGG